MIIDKVYILYGTKNNDVYYITNLDPAIWTNDITRARQFSTSSSAQNAVIENYNVYIQLTSELNNNTLEHIFISSRLINDIAKEFDRRILL